MDSIRTPLHLLPRRVGSDDLPAFRQLYAAWAPTVLTAVLRELPDRDEAIAVVRAAFFELWVMARRGDPRDHDIGGWVTAIARRRAAERRRGTGDDLLGELLAEYDRCVELQLATLLGPPDGDALTGDAAA